jgi:hypothetical protein
VTHVDGVRGSGRKGSSQTFDWLWGGEQDPIPVHYCDMRAPEFEQDGSYMLFSENPNDDVWPTYTTVG